MTTLHAGTLGETILLPRPEFERLVWLARQQEEIAIEVREGDFTTPDIMKLAEADPAFDWLRDEPDLYTLDDLKVRYR